MSDKAKNKMMVAAMFVSLLLIFGSYPAINPSVANAAKDEAMAKAPEKVELEDPEEEKKLKLEEDDEDLLDLLMKMKLMEKDMEDVLMSDSNRDRFFDPDITKGLVDKDLMTKLLLLEEGLLEELDKAMAEAGMKVEEDVEIPEIKEEEPVEVKELDDEDLLKLALDMKDLAKELDKYMESSDGGDWEGFRRAFNAGLAPRPFFGRMVCLQRSFVDPFDPRFGGFRPPCPSFPRVPFFGPPFFRPPFERPPFFGPPFGDDDEDDD